MKIMSERVVGIVPQEQTSFWSWDYPFFHKRETVLIYFTKSGVYKYSFKNGHSCIVKIKRRYRKKI